jgi:hypothetical protein
MLDAPVGWDRRVGKRCYAKRACTDNDNPAGSHEPLQQLNLPRVIEVVRRDASNEEGFGVRAGPLAKCTLGELGTGRPP